MGEQGANAPMPEGAEAPIPVYINRTAGPQGDRSLEIVMAALERRGIAAEARPVPPQNLAESVGDAAEQGRGMVVVCGGDGTIASAAGMLAGRPTVLAPFPTGTFNHFAHRYGIMSVDDAAEAVASRRVIRVSIGDINGTVFINNASCGLYPYALRHRERLRRWVSKWPAHVIGWGQSLMHLPRLDLCLEVEGREIRRRTSMLWVGIGKGSFQFPERAPGVEDDSLLEVVIARPQTRTGLLILATELMGGVVRGERVRGGHNLEVFHTTRMTVHATRRTIDVARDGEIDRMDSPLTISIRVGALRVAAPAEKGSER